MGSAYSCRRSRIDEQPLPPRVVHLNAHDDNEANKGRKSIFVHHRVIRKKAVNDPPSKVMNAAPPPRQGAPQRNYLPRNNLPEVIDLISDDEDDFDDELEEFEDEDVGNLYEATPVPAEIPQIIQRQPSPYGPPAPNVPPPPVNNANEDDWEGFFDEDGGRHYFDGYDDLDVQDAALERVMMEEYNHHSRNREAPAAAPAQIDEPFGFIQDQEDIVQRPAPQVESKLGCVNQLVAVFPDICRDYVSGLYDSISQTSDRLIAHILDKVEKGTSYPTAKEMQKSLKRKRELDEDEEATRKYGAVDRIMPARLGNIRALIRTLLSMEFPETPMVFIDACLAQSGFRLFSAYRVLEEAHRTFDRNAPAYNKMKTSRKIPPMNREDNIESLLQSLAGNPQEVEIVQELQAARKIRKKADAKREAEQQLILDEEANVRKAEAEGTMSECGCCFGDFPLNRMIHCNNEELLHWFCRGCAKQSAETEIGNSKYHLRCMSMDGCEAGFSIEQRSLFLDENTVIALERNEQEAVLRMAGIENLASCPFCPYAAEYPPVEENREFRCQAPDCEKISCRFCKLESHIPKSCEEHAKENGLSIRRQIEEAMSAALIRKCNKCGTPFVKEEGCNKMTCTRNGCLNVQCYVCSKSCGYDHFDDSRRGGKAGNCPLFESVEQRHDDEVKRAEKEALDKVRAEHPEYSEDDLKVKMSEQVIKDDERRKANDPRARILAMQAGVHPLARYALPHIRRPIAGEAPRAFGGAFGIFNLGADDAMFNGLWDNVPPPVQLPGQFLPPVQEAFARAIGELPGQAGPVAQGAGVIGGAGAVEDRAERLDEYIRRRRPQWPDAERLELLNLPRFGGRAPQAEANAANPPALDHPAPGINQRLSFRQLQRRLNERPEPGQQGQANGEVANLGNAVGNANNNPGVSVAVIQPNAENNANVYPDIPGVFRRRAAQPQGAAAQAAGNLRDQQFAQIMADLEQLAPVDRNRRRNEQAVARVVAADVQRQRLRLEALREHVNQRKEVVARRVQARADAEQQLGGAQNFAIQPRAQELGFDEEGHRREGEAPVLTDLQAARQRAFQRNLDQFNRRN